MAIKVPVVSISRGYLDANRFAGSPVPGPRSSNFRNSRIHDIPVLQSAIRTSEFPGDNMRHPKIALPIQFRMFAGFCTAGPRFRRAAQISIGVRGAAMQTAFGIGDAMARTVEFEAGTGFDR